MLMFLPTISATKVEADTYSIDYVIKPTTNSDNVKIILNPTANPDTKGHFYSSSDNISNVTIPSSGAGIQLENLRISISTTYNTATIEFAASENVNITFSFGSTEDSLSSTATQSTKSSLQTFNLAGLSYITQYFYNTTYCDIAEIEHKMSCILERKGKVWHQ